MDDQQQDEVFMSPRDPASHLDQTSAAAAAAVWEEATKAIDGTPSGADGAAGGGQSGGGGSTDPWDVPSGAEGGGIIAELEREQANRLPEDDTPRRPAS
jgi:hypothetical protein